MSTHDVRGCSAVASGLLSWRILHRSPSTQARQSQSGGNHETPPESTLPDPPLPLLLRKRANPKGIAPAPDGRQAGRRLTPSSGIPGTSLERRNAEAPRPEDRRPEGRLRPLQGKVHRLWRRGPRPHPSQRYGRSMEGRPPRQHSGRPLLVQ